jgi:hypothetical protein
MLLTSLFLSLAAATTGAPTPPTPLDRAVRPTCLVQVSSPQAARRAGDDVPSFSATGILDLRIRTLVGRAAGPGTLYLRLFTPRGHLYQTLIVPYGIPRVGDAPVRARLVRRAIDATLPVAGTSIMTDGLYGQWVVEPWLGGASTACGPARAFDISQ